MRGWLVLSIGLAFPAIAGPAGEAFTSPLGFPLLEADLQQIQAQLGAAPVSTAGHHEDTICYVWPKPKALVLFTLGQEGIGAGFEARMLTGKASVGCVAPAKDKAKQELTVGGLYLGMTKQEFEKVVGPTKAKDNGRLDFEVWRQEPIPPRNDQATEPGFFDVGIGIEGTFVNDRLTGLLIWKSVST